MSMQAISQITIDNFTELSPADHSVAVFNYARSIEQLERQLQDSLNEPARQLLTDELQHCLTLRKLHVRALAEQLEIVIPARIAA